MFRKNSVPLLRVLTSGLADTTIEGASSHETSGAVASTNSVMRTLLSIGLPYPALPARFWIQYILD